MKDKESRAKMQLEIEAFDCHNKTEYELAHSIKEDNGIVFCSEMQRGTELVIEMSESI